MDESVENKIEEVNNNVKSLINYRSTGCLGIILFIGALGSVTTCSRGCFSKENKYTPLMNRENVMGERDMEKFIEVNGEKFYAEIDGIRIEDYVKRR